MEIQRLIDSKRDICRMFRLLSNKTLVYCHLTVSAPLRICSKRMLAQPPLQRNSQLVRHTSIKTTAELVNINASIALQNILVLDSSHYVYASSSESLSTFCHASRYPVPLPFARSHLSYRLQHVILLHVKCT